jgi:exopolysaccharide production protein ExoY
MPPSPPGGFVTISSVRSTLDPVGADGALAVEGAQPRRVARPALQPGSQPGFPLTIASSIFGSPAAIVSRQAAGGAAGFPHGAGRIAKRLMDMFIAVTMLLVLSPVLLMVALLVRSRMGGDIFYSQKRVGRNGKMFACYKFRTMVSNGAAVLDAHLAVNPDADKEWRENQKLTNDPRVTPLGHALRKSSLDELPQLYNVLIGDMSCVGPRPIVQSELERYGAHKAHYLSVRPGLTGAWQISGRSQLSYAERVRLDVEYVSNWTLKRDIVILVKTIPAVAKFEQAV